MPRHWYLVLLEAKRTGDALTLRLLGAWCIDNIAEIEATLDQLPPSDARRLLVDTSQIEVLDLSGAWLLRQRLNALQESGSQVSFVGEPPQHFAFIEEITAQAGRRDRWRTRGNLTARCDRVGWPRCRAPGAQARDAMGFFGRIAVTTMRSLRSLHHLRVPSMVRHVYETGIQAIPIVSLIAFLISVIVAYLGAQQLRQFGAEIFTVDLVAIAVLREMGVLLTAIIVAGRSGSAFAAEIGVMRLNDEIDALQSMGVDYFEVLVLPRLIGLLIALPLLTIVADAMGLAGGALLSSLLLDISTDAVHAANAGCTRADDVLGGLDQGAGVRGPDRDGRHLSRHAGAGFLPRARSPHDSRRRAVDLPGDLRRRGVRDGVRGAGLLKEATGRWATGLLARSMDVRKRTVRRGRRPIRAAEVSASPSSRFAASSTASARRSCTMASIWTSIRARCSASSAAPGSGKSVLLRTMLGLASAHGRGGA